MTTINVTAAKLAELNAASSVAKLESGRITATTFVNGVEYVTTGAVGNGKGAGVVSVDGYTLQEVHNYDFARHLEPRPDDIVPMRYREHWNAVNAGLRERCYRGMSTRLHNREIVLLDKVTFTCSEAKAEELKLF